MADSSIGAKRVHDLKVDITEVEIPVLHGVTSVVKARLHVMDDVVHVEVTSSGDLDRLFARKIVAGHLRAGRAAIPIGLRVRIADGDVEVPSYEDASEVAHV
jgi:hypothetical protein